ncbi:hypothetical protein HPP92_006651 [Vanilla planifolia]|uniref:PAR1 protein n=1 Tax=Vanilla planifolia TaxID=51239 RepID=A0A835V8N4_VANPL|nr:hypothetical protein HPP92_006651 [Vanilla planifolia]
MASSSVIASALILSLVLLLQSANATVVCEELPQDLCTFSISSAGKRCVLESFRRSRVEGVATTEYYCRTSEVLVDRFSDWIETDECVNACGADRAAVGISSDALLDPNFTSKLCSTACYQSCPNVIDLYFNLAAGEGVSLPELCEARRSNPHRSMAELVRSSGLVVPGDVAVASAPSPF